MGNEEFAKSLDKAAESLEELLNSKNEPEFYEELVDKLSRMLAGWIFYCEVANEIKNDNLELSEQLKYSWSDYSKVIERAHAEWKRNDDEIEDLTKTRLAWLDGMRKTMTAYAENPDKYEDLRVVYDELSRKVR